MGELVEGVVSMGNEIRDYDVLRISLWVWNLKMRANTLERRLNALSQAMQDVVGKLHKNFSAIDSFLRTKDTSELRQTALRAIRDAHTRAERPGGGPRAPRCINPVWPPPEDPFEKSRLPPSHPVYTQFILFARRIFGNELPPPPSPRRLALEPIGDLGKLQPRPGTLVSSKAPEEDIPHGTQRQQAPPHQDSSPMASPMTSFIVDKERRREPTASSSSPEASSAKKTRLRSAARFSGSPGPRSKTSLRSPSGAVHSSAPSSEEESSTVERVAATLSPSPPTLRADRLENKYIVDCFARNKNVSQLHELLGRSPKPWTASTPIELPPILLPGAPLS